MRGGVHIAARAPARRPPRAAAARGAMTDAEFATALAKARSCIHNHPKGQSRGRAGERCVVEDGERHARRAATARPDDAAPALLVVQSLARQRGRECDAVVVAADALENCGGLRSDAGAARAVVAAALAACPTPDAAAALVAAAGPEVRDAVAAAAAAADGVGLRGD